MLDRCNHALMWGISNFEKNKKAWLLFHCIYGIVVQYKFAHCFTPKLRKIKRKDKEIKKQSLIGKMYSSSLELMAPGSRDRRSNHFAMEDSRFGKFIFPIYRQSIFIINFNTDKTGSRQSELFFCLPTY